MNLFDLPYELICHISEYLSYDIQNFIMIIKCKILKNYLYNYSNHLINLNHLSILKNICRFTSKKNNYIISVENADLQIYKIISKLKNYNKRLFQININILILDYNMIFLGMSKIYIKKYLIKLFQYIDFNKLYILHRKYHGIFYDEFIEFQYILENIINKNNIVYLKLYSANQIYKDDISDLKKLIECKNYNKIIYNGQHDYITNYNTITNIISHYNIYKNNNIKINVNYLELLHNHNYLYMFLS